MCVVWEGIVKRDDNMEESDAWEEGMKESEIKKEAFLIEEAIKGLEKNCIFFLKE